jgi:hypothetical protein
MFVFMKYIALASCLFLGACGMPVRTARVLRLAPQPSISTQAIPNATVGKPYGFQWKAYGGTPPYHWGITLVTPHSVVLTVTPNPLNPPGVMYNYYRCTGECMLPGSYTLIGTSLEQYIDSGVAGGNTYTYYATAVLNGNESGPSPLARAIVPIAPVGLSMSAAGWLSGTPTSPGTYSITAMVIDSKNRRRSKTLPMVIAPAPLTIGCSGPNLTLRPNGVCQINYPFQVGVPVNTQFGIIPLVR